MLDMIALGRKIRLAFESRDIRRCHAARALNIHPSSVGHWCRGRGLPTLLHQQNLVNYLNSLDKDRGNSPAVSLTIDDFTPFNP